MVLIPFVVCELLIRHSVVSERTVDMRLGVIFVSFQVIVSDVAPRNASKFPDFDFLKARLHFFFVF